MVAAEATAWGLDWEAAGAGAETAWAAETALGPGSVVAAAAGEEAVVAAGSAEAARAQAQAQAASGC